MRGVKLGAPAQRLLYLVLDLAGLRPGIDADQVGDSQHARQVVDSVFRLLPLEVPIDFAAKRHDAFFDLYRDSIGRNPDAPPQDVSRALGDFVIPGLFVRGKSDLDLLRDRADTEDAPGRSLGSQFVSVARNRPRQGNDAVRSEERRVG